MSGKTYVVEINQNFLAGGEQYYCQSSKHDPQTVGGANIWNNSLWIFKYLTLRSMIV